MVFIAFEGGDGAGKSTQVAALAAWLRERGQEVVVTREPGGTELGGRIRELLLHGGEVAPRAEALLFAADRAHHVATFVRPALERGAVVLTDRYVDSSVAYQGAGRDLQAAEIAGLSAWATGGLVPHLTALLDVAPETGRARRSCRVEDRMETEAEAFHARVRQGFLALAEAAPHRYLVLDAAQPPEVISAAVVARVGELLAGADPTLRTPASTSSSSTTAVAAPGPDPAESAAPTRDSAATSEHVAPSAPSSSGEVVGRSESRSGGA
ncbi:dTMP kinase [Mobilicoccus pelagius]|uniref:Thymidylate kinase n=1 Tax=Mobilicoccus pelagius NBRC 104925 TaxID=1089455 RepID=H5UNZ4_9MICO|nr:dTMP kinase [Mobilicoccus pelagius]GAB47452.1 thymidylate kinase [Mobilicoccus pelagius NBRC 104925]